MEMNRGVTHCVDSGRVTASEVTAQTGGIGFATLDSIDLIT
jgi:hypothetical protein